MPGNGAERSFESGPQTVEDRSEKMKQMVSGVPGNSSESARGRSLSEMKPQGNPQGNSVAPPAHTGKKAGSDTPLVSRLPQSPAEAQSPDLSIGEDLSHPIPVHSPEDQETSKAGQKSSQRLGDFFNALPPDKLALAETIFQSHFDSLRTNIDEALKQGYSPKELNMLIYEDHKRILEEMKGVLSEQEYTAYLNAAPKFPDPQKPPHQN